MRLDVGGKFRHFLALLDIFGGVFVGLLGIHPVVGLDFLDFVDISVALEDVDVGGSPFFVGQVVCLYFVVVARKFLQNFGGAQPPVFVVYAHRGVAPNAGLDLLADIPAQGDFVQALKPGVDVGDKHVPTAHAGVALLVGVRGVVPFSVVGAVVGNEFFKGVVSFVFPLFVGLVADFLALDPVLAFAVEPADAGVVLVGYRPLEGAVHGLGIFFLGVLRCAEVHEGKGNTGLQEAVFVFAHQVLLDFDAGGHAPAVAFDEPEHVAEAFCHQCIVFLAGIGCPDPALAHYVVGIVGVDALVAFHPARQVDVVHGDL